MLETEARPLLVIEIFTSIQGEGLRIGRPSTFVRLAHCNLKCAWCDTTYSWKPGEMATPERMTAEAVATRFLAPDLVLTGGEPLLHDLAPLLDLAGERFITVETNATLFKPHPRVGLWSLSPKLGSSGHRPNLAIISQYLAEVPDKVQFKFVVNGGADLAEVKELLAEFPAIQERRIPVILQPVGIAGQDRDSYCEGMRATIEDELLTDPYWMGLEMRFLPQLHKLIWQDKRGI